MNVRDIYIGPNLMKTTLVPNVGSIVTPNIKRYKNIGKN